MNKVCINVREKGRCDDRFCLVCDRRPEWVKRAQEARERSGFVAVADKTTR